MCIRDSAFAANAPLPQSSVIMPVEWNGDPNWRDTYMSLDDPAKPAKTVVANSASHAANERDIGGSY